MANDAAKVLSPAKLRRGLDLGALHPAAVQPIVDMPGPERVFIPLKQHKGGWCEPKVVVGDKVKVGQILGESTNPDSAPVHASVSGEVTAVGDHLDPYGRTVPTVTIRNDGADEWETPPEANDDFMEAKLSVMMKAVRLSGVVQGDTGRPVHSMLAPPERPQSYIFLVGIPLIKPVEVLIASMLDREPCLAVNRRLLQERFRDLSLGLKLIKKLVGAKQGLLAVDDEIGVGATAVGEAAEDVFTPVAVRNRYPVAVPELLTTALTGREVPWPDGAPRDVGAMVMDAETILAVLDAVRNRRPQVDRFVTVTGSEMAPKNVRVRLGTPIADLIAFAGGKFERAAKVVVGGLMDGMAQYSGQVPVTKETQGVHLLSDRQLVRFTEQLCIQVRPLRQRLPHAAPAQRHYQLLRVRPLCRSRGGGAVQMH